MRRRAFLINSSVILLLIPLMLLLATYEDVSYQIIHAQSERMQIESTFDVVSSLELNFQKALEISTKRALITTTEYVASKGFISGEMANQTIADLIIWGQSPVGISSDQSLGMWLQNITSILRRQGYNISPSVNDILNNITIRVAPLDSFHIAVIARIPRIKITSASGGVIYEGAIPENRNVTVIVSLEGIEDTFIARETYDLYHRLIKACSYPYPELVERPIKVLSGTGESEVPVVTGVYGEDINYNATHIWKDSSTNTTINGVSVSPLDVIKDGDVGVLVFENIGTTGPKTWSVSTQEEWQENTQSGTNYEISTGELTLKKYWKVLWSFGSASVSYGETKTIANVPSLPTSIEYKWTTSLKIEKSGLWLESPTLKISLTKIGVSMECKGSCPDISKRFTENPSSSPVLLELSGGLGIGSATGYTQNNIIEGYVYHQNGDWTSVVWDPKLSKPAQIQSFNVTTSIGTLEEVYVQVGVDINNDGIIDQWTPWLLLNDGINVMTSLNLPLGYRWQVKFQLKTLDNNDLRHAPRVQKYSLLVKPLEEESGSNSRAYDIQPFIECLENGYYFGIYNAPSFFERLEGNFNPDRHRKYEALANRTQDLLGISYNGKHYPIGLVSFILPSDSRIQLVLNTAGATLTNQTSFDYYFLKYYIDGSTEKEGYKMYGVSAGNVITDENFYLDYETAVALFGTQGAQDLLQR